MSNTDCKSLHSPRCTNVYTEPLKQSERPTTDARRCIFEVELQFHILFIRQHRPLYSWAGGFCRCFSQGRSQDAPDTRLGNHMHKNPDTTLKPVQTYYSLWLKQVKIEFLHPSSQLCGVIRLRGQVENK